MIDPTGNPSPARTAADSESMTMGAQPLDALLEERGLNNHDVVAAAGDNGLTHKVVQKARKGRQLTIRAQKKVLAAVNAANQKRDLPLIQHSEAFNYIGR